MDVERYEMDVEEYETEKWVVIYWWEYSLDGKNVEFFDEIDKAKEFVDQKMIEGYDVICLGEVVELID